VNKTHPLQHVIFAMTVAFAAFTDNWYGATGWAVAWLAFVFSDYEAAKARVAVFAAGLFIDAHNRKWPSAKAEDEAAKRLAEFQRTMR
jgi:hypothetical protein